MTDVLHRLQAANPVDPDDAAGGVVPLAASPSPTTRTAIVPRRALLAGGAVAALAVGVGLVGLPSGHDAGTVDVAAAAVRALSPDGSILHVVTQTTEPAPDGGVQTSRSELWLAPDGRHGRTRIIGSDGTVLVDSVLRGDGGLFGDLVDARKMIERRSLVPVGDEEQIGGRRVQPFVGAGGERTWYLDAETHEPVRVVLTVHHLGSVDDAGPDVTAAVVVDYLRFERLDDNAANRRLLTPPQPTPPQPVGPPREPTP